MRKKKRIETDGGGFGGSMADLLRAEGFELNESPTTEPVAIEPAASLADVKRVRLQFERKGRRGKAVTVVTGLDVLGDALPGVLKTLRKSLGCGATIDGAQVIVQGDQRTRLVAWFNAEGVHDVR